MGRVLCKSASLRPTTGMGAVGEAFCSSYGVKLYCTELWCGAGGGKEWQKFEKKTKGKKTRWNEVQSSQQKEMKIDCSTGDDRNGGIRGRKVHSGKKGLGKTVEAKRH